MLKLACVVSALTLAAIAPANALPEAGVNVVPEPGVSGLLAAAALALTLRGRRR